MNKLILALLLMFSSSSLLCLTSCASSGGGGADDVEEVALVGAPITITEDFFGNALEMIVGDTMIFKSYDPEYIYLTATVENDSIVAQQPFAHRGAGPDEFIVAALLGGADAEVQIVGGNYNDINYIGDLSFCPVSYSNTSAIDYCNGIVWDGNAMAKIGTDSILFVGSTFDDPAHIYSIINLRNKTLTHLDYWPDDGYKGDDVAKLMLYFTNSRLGSNGKGRFVYSLGVNRFAYIFEIEGSGISIKKRLFDDMVRYSQADDGVNFNYAPEPEGLRLTATASAIYVLLIDKDSKGETADEFADSHFGNVVLRYDWDGNLTGRYVLDHIGANIVSDAGGQNLYLQTIDMEAGELGLVRYHIEN